MKDPLAKAMDSPFSTGFVVTMAGSLIVLVVIVILGYRAAKLDQLHQDVRQIRDELKANHQDIQRLEGGR